jgi:hypothetical protein
MKTSFLILAPKIHLPTRLALTSGKHRGTSFKVPLFFCDLAVNGDS